MDEKTIMHPIEWDDSELLVPVSSYYARQIRESVEIYKNKTIPQDGKPLHDTWTCLFDYSCFIVIR